MARGFLLFKSLELPESAIPFKPVSLSHLSLHEEVPSWFCSVPLQKFVVLRSPFPPQVSKSIFICTTPRSRSTFFADALRATGVMGNPQEWMTHNVHAETLGLYGLHNSAAVWLQCQAMIHRSCNGGAVFSVKAIDHFFANWCQKLRSELDLEKDEPIWTHLEGLFPNPKFIFWRRRSRLRQVISLEKASQGTKWHDDDTVSKRDPSQLLFDPFHLKWSLEEYAVREERWLSFFRDNNLPYLELWDDELMGDFDGTLRRVADYCEVEMEAAPLDTSCVVRKPVGDAINDLWESWFEEGERAGLPSDFQESSTHWSNYTHRLWIEAPVEPFEILHGEPILVPIILRNLSEEPLVLHNSSGPARIAAIRAQWVDHRNGHHRVLEAQCPVPTVLEPFEFYRLEIPVTRTGWIREFSLFLFPVVQDQTWVRLNGVNSPQIHFVKKEANKG